MVKLHPYLNFQGNAEDAFEFYKSVFGGEFGSVVRFRDMPMEGLQIPEGEADKIMHIGLPIGPDEYLMASDALESMGQKVVQGNSVYISVQPESKQEADRIFAALSEGGEIEMDLADQVWGDYFGSFKDKFGVHWMLNYSYPKEA